MPASILLRTERLTLRRFVEADAELLYALDEDPEVRRWVHAGPPDLRRIREVVLPRLLSYYARYPQWGFWAAEEGPARAFVGWFHLRPAPGHSGRGLGTGQGGEEPLELGYRLRRDAWGRGLATEGSRALLRWASQEHGATRIEAVTLIGNRASQRVLEKAGFARVEEFVYEPPPWAEVPTDPHSRRSYRYVWQAGPEA